MTRRVRCPVCDELSIRSGACDCGYDFDTGDPGGALVRLSYARRRADKLVNRGMATVLAAAIPALFLGDIPLVHQLELVTVIIAQLVLGTWWSARGVLGRRAVRRQRTAIATLGALPEARVIE
jgi:hypothetical protein